MKKLILGIFILTIHATCFAVTAQNLDRFESFNRWSFKLNSKMDKHVLRPVTVWYITYIPFPIRYSIGNFYDNLRDFVSLGNDILQLNGMATMHTMMRISINSTFGMAGLIDISSNLGLPQEKNSFGKTMRVYGWKNSSYLVVPLLGPSTVRDTIGTFPDIYFNPTWYLVNDYVSVGLYVVNAIDTRARFIGPDKVLEASSIDPYVSMRDFYLQSIGEVVPTSSTNNDMNINMFLDDSDLESAPIKESAPTSKFTPQIESVPRFVESGHIEDESSRNLNLEESAQQFFDPL